MTVLLTGASGFLGIHILRRLLEDDQRVRAFVRTPTKLHEHLAALGVDPDDKRVEVVAGDLTRDVLGITGRPLLDSLRETVAWLVAAGHLSPKAAGTAVG